MFWRFVFLVLLLLLLLLVDQLRENDPAAPLPITPIDSNNTIPALRNAVKNGTFSGQDTKKSGGEEKIFV